MSRKTKNKKKLQMGLYIIAFIDLLGQQSLLRKLTELSENNSKSEEKTFRETIKKTYGAVNGMQELLDNFYSEYRKQHIDTSDLNSDQKKFIQNWSKPKIKFQRFSDCIAIYAPLHSDNSQISTNSIFGIIGAVASTFVTCLAGGQPIRGGIDIGLAMEVRKNEIYGPALSRAYTLESKIANYPRVVIGAELELFLQTIANTEPIDSHDTINRDMAQLCMENLAVDHDGYPIIDYLSEPFLKALPKNSKEELVNKCSVMSG